MKSLFVSVLTLALGASSVMADEVIQCSSEFVADNGYAVSILRNTSGRGFVAVLSQYTFLGETPIAQARVEKAVSDDLLSFVGKNLRLDIDLNTLPVAPAGLSSAKAVLSGTLVREIEFANLNCFILAPSVLPTPPTGPGYTCMAYWQGVHFNPATQACEKAGASGCSNPFEFKTITDCEKAFATRILN